jgi:hypothetical protein
LVGKPLSECLQHTHFCTQFMHADPHIPSAAPPLDGLYNHMTRPLASHDLHRIAPAGGTRFDPAVPHSYQTLAGHTGALEDTIARALAAGADARSLAHVIQRSFVPTSANHHDQHSIIPTFANHHAGIALPGAASAVPAGAVPPRKLFSREVTDSVSELPPSAVKILKSGFKSYLPLSSCTHKACRVATRTLDSLDAEISLGEKGDIKVKQKNMSAAKDHHITTDDFSQIRENLVSGIRKHLILTGKSETGRPSAHACADMFALFFTNIAMRPDWTEDWPTYRSFLVDRYFSWTARADDEIGFVFREGTYNEFKVKSIKDIVRREMGATSGNIGGSYAMTGGRGRGFTPNYGRRHDRGGPSRGPLVRQPPSCDSSSSFRDSSNEVTIICFLCGGSHIHKEHQGPAKRLVFEGGKWIDKALGDKIVCILFNVSPRGCQKPGCTYSHTCSLCGDPNHGAAGCSV